MDDVSVPGPILRYVRAQISDNKNLKWLLAVADPEIARGGAKAHVFAQGGATIQVFVKLGVQIPIFKRKFLCLLVKLSGQGGA